MSFAISTGSSIPSRKRREARKPWATIIKLLAILNIILVIGLTYAVNQKKQAPKSSVRTRSVSTQQQVASTEKGIRIRGASASLMQVDNHDSIQVSFIIKNETEKNATVSNGPGGYRAKIDGKDFFPRLRGVWGKIISPGQEEVIELRIDGSLGEFSRQGSFEKLELSLIVREAMMEAFGGQPVALGELARPRMVIPIQKPRRLATR